MILSIILREWIEGKQKILVSLSHYLKGRHTSLECFVNDYHLIMLKGQMEGNQVSAVVIEGVHGHIAMAQICPMPPRIIQIK